MLKKIYYNLKLIWHGLFYGMSNAEKIINTPSAMSSDGIEIIQQKSNGGVFADMLEKKQTQQVKETVDAYYRIYKEANKFDTSSIKIIGEDENGIIDFGEYNKGTIYTCDMVELTKEEALEYTKYGCINIHGSILPKYRGSAPIQWTVLNGDKLAGVTDPETKRKIIGKEFIEVFAEAASKTGAEFLGQGTIYPDIAESGTKTAKVVKSHHNVGGLPEDLQFELVEPLKQLFKDEVRACGVELGLPYEMVYRQPFPGPGLGVRCLGAITRDRLEALRESDAILREEFALAGLDKKVWQYFTVVPDFKSVGVRDNARSYDWPVIIRAVNTIDAMTASIEQIEWPILMKITDRILAEIPTVNRVCYDLSPKPSATIEWEQGGNPGSNPQKEAKSRI